MSETSPALETAAPADPIDTMDVGSIWDDTGTEPLLPESMLLDGKREPAPEPTAEAPPEAGQPRDERGKFAAKEPKPEEQQPVADAPKAEPFKYRAVGQTHEFPGATLDEKGGVYVAPESVGAFRAALNAKHLAEGEYVPLIESHKQRIQELESQVGQGTEAEAKANALVTSLTAALQNPDEVAALEAFYKLRTDMPSLIANAEAAYWRAKATKPTAVQPPKAEAPTMASPSLPSPEVAGQMTTEYLEQCKVELPEFRDVTPEDWKQIGASLQRTPYAFLRAATPEEVQAGTFHQGEILYDTDALIAYVQAESTKAKAQRETARTGASVAASNARRTQPSIATPPTPKGNAAPVATGQRKGFTSAKDVNDWLNNDEL